MSIYKKITLGLIIGFICIILLVSGAYIFIFGKGQMSNDVSDYRDWRETSRSGLFIFPEDLENAQNVSYNYFYQDTILSPTYEIFLTCTYDIESYNKEVARLSELSAEYEGDKQDIKYDSDNYKYPVFETINNWSGCNEYALLNDKENTIIYVFLQHSKGSKIKLLEEYRPTREDKKETYNMYAFAIDEHRFHIVK